MPEAKGRDQRSAGQSQTQAKTKPKINPWPKEICRQEKKTVCRLSPLALAGPGQKCLVSDIEVVAQYRQPPNTVVQRTRPSAVGQAQRQGTLFLFSPSCQPEK
ncbi:hypothetical protein Celaphus_00015938 [Cervus elaphus hippelaphus]|uniref:Uncharacterized protein n=1 Tax=Cervus elaphus hippelaphus TaxID=46360 RepID=A0A212C1T7_CEREH|nr:hypothetical protein Celaphus_00015938 [Cervus elaphus hippelaphus]